MKRARVVASAVVVAIAVGVSARVHADTPAQDLARASSTTTGGGTLKDKLAGSSAEVSTYMGSGTFYASGYRDPYVSMALYLRPSYDLGTKYKLALRARIYVEEEFTLPDNKAGRRFYPYDPYLWLSADNLHTFERSKIRIGGLARAIFPLSYESRYQHLVMGLGAGLTANRSFDFGKINDEARKWSLGLTYGFIFYKFLQTSDFRGSGPGDTTGCLAPPSAGAPGIGGGGGPTASAADRCGGPANPNFELVDLIIATLAHGKWSLSMSLMVMNTFNYAIPIDMLSPDAAVATGRTDNTWGIIAAGYQMTPHLTVSAGISSMQPALDARYQSLRFPFFDFTSGANANNFTQLFLSLSGSL